MDRSQLMATAERVSSKRYPVESGRISSNEATLLGLFDLDRPTWVIEIHHTSLPHYICLSQRSTDIFCHSIVGEGEIDWRKWMGLEAPSVTNSGDHPETFANYHHQAVKFHEQPNPKNHH